MTRLSKHARELLIEEAIDFTPVWGKEYVRAAFAGDVDAAIRLAVSLHDHQRAEMAGMMYRARVAPPAFRAVLETALSQTHCYSHVERHSRGILGFFKWCRYAQFPIPDDLPDVVTIYRGVKNCSPFDAAFGLSWTLDFDVAAWFACRWAGPEDRPLVVTIDDFPKADIVGFIDDRNEREVIPGPSSARADYRVIDDRVALAEAYARKEAEIRQHQDDHLRECREAAE
jgi:hypothetical protein